MINQRKHVCFWAIAVLFTTVGVAVADDGIPFPNIAGPELWIDGPDNVQLGNSSGNPDVAVANDGTRIHVWNAGGIGGSSAGEIILRRWSAEGMPLEDPRQINTTTDDIQRYPRVAVATDGTFLVIWQSWEAAQPGGAERIVIRSQAFDADGNTVGPEQRLSTLLTNGTTNNYADVAALRTSDGSPGGYVVVWKSADSAGPDTNGSIQGCRVSPTGVPDAQIQINQIAGGSQNWSSVTELIDGGFLAVWTDGDEVMGRRFNSAFVGGNDFQITTFPTADASVTDAALGWNGEVLIVWQDDEDGPNSTEIRGRLFDDELNALGPDFRINTVVDDSQTHPRIAAYGTKGFLIVWGSDVASGSDLGGSIEARVVSGPNAFDANGDGLDDPQLQYNTWDNDNTQQDPGANGWYGRISTPWDTLTWDGVPEPDNINDQFIVGRDIEDCMFCDDFEWFSPASPGSLWRWSATAGVVP